jgi:integral membrane protein
MSIKTLKGQFRWIAILEGISFIAIGFTMMLKYGLDIKGPNYVVGMAHGFLFMAYCFYLLKLSLDEKWEITKTILLFIASLVPFGTFWAVKKYNI